MKIMRVFMHPDGDTVIDMGVPDDLNMALFWNLTKRDGGIIAEGAFVPTSTIHHIEIMAPAQHTTLTVFPGGRPN